MPWYVHCRNDDATHLPPTANLTPEQAAPKSKTLWVFVAFLLPFAAVAAHHWSWTPPSQSGDYAQYLSHARALVEGRSYTDIGYIYHPAAPMVGPRAYPPGLSVTLAPIVAVAGVTSPLFRVLMLLTVLAFAYLAYRRLTMDIPAWQAAIAGGYSALVIETRFGTLVPLSDLGLCALVWATILAVDTTRQWTWKRIALVTALGFAAMAYRVAGIALVPALGLYALTTWRQTRLKPLVPVAVWVGSGIAVLALSAIELPFADLLIPRVSEIAERARHALTVYPVAALSAQLYPFAGNRPNDIYHIVASIAMVIGLLVLLWRLRRTMLTAFVVAYSAMLFASPAINDRYLWPLLPVLVAGLVLAVNVAWRAIATRLGWRSRGPILAAATMALIATAAAAREATRPPLPSDHRDPNRVALFAWLRETNTRQPLRVVYSNPRVLTLETRVPAMPPLFAKPNYHVAAFYDRDITHMVWPVVTPNDCRSRLAHELVQLYPDRFAVDYENPGYRVYRVLRPPGPIPPIENYHPTWGGNRCDPGRPDLDPDNRR